MASDGHGGYRRPANPAPASGPGALSRRTDGRQPARVAPGGDYGSRQEMQALQESAPMAESNPVANGAAAAAQAQPIDPSSLTPLTAPTGQPNVGLLDNLGAMADAGPSPTAIDDQTRARLEAYLPTLLWLGSQPEASEQTRQFVRQLKADL